MGRSYWFECSRCGYRVRASGGLDRGRDFYVETIVCAECKQVYDAVTRLRFPRQQLLAPGFRPLRSRVDARPPKRPPTFEAVVSRLPYEGVRHLRWIHFGLQCPVSPSHRVRSWSDPGKCPRCGIVMEKGVLPYRVWD
jgi:hypothetical protein